MPSKIPLLETKMMPPQLASSFVIRTKFVDAIKVAADYKLISVSAPAGFGKTTALVQAIEHLTKKYPLAWISLDTRDNQGTVFLQYLVAALQSIDKTLGLSIQQLIDSSHPPELMQSINDLINDIVHFEQDFFIILDDFHFISSGEIQQFLEVLINLAPSNFHLIIASRTHVDFPIITKNAGTDTLQLSTSELRFDLEETRNFFKSQKKLNDAQLLEIYQRSEGWAAGLQLATLYLNKLSNDDNKLLTSMGNLRDIADYLAREVLDQQTTSIAEFLLKTSLLERFNAKVCDHLVNRTDSQEVLRTLEELNLFLVPLDENREWYRYHHFFQDFLQTQLQRELPEQAPELYRDASMWFQENQMFHEAVEYALEGEQYDMASNLIEERTTAEFKSGRMPQVNEWISRIPTSVLKRQPALLLIQGTALYHMNQSAAAKSKCNTLRIYLKNNSENLSSQQSKNISLECDVLEAGANMSEDRCENPLTLMPSLTDMAPSFTLGAAYNILGYAYYRSGDFALAEKHYLLGKSKHSEIDQQFGVVYSDCFRAIMRLTQGQLSDAFQLIDNLGRTKSKSPITAKNVASVVDILSGVIAYERQDFDTAQHLLGISLLQLERVGHIHILLTGYRALIKTQLCNKDFVKAYTTIDYVINELGASLRQSNRLFIESLRIEAYLHEGRLADALNLATRLKVSLDDEASQAPAVWKETYYLNEAIKIRILIAAGQNSLAQQFISPLLDYLKSNDQNYRYYELLLLQTISSCTIGLEQFCVNSGLLFIRETAPHGIFSQLILERDSFKACLTILSKSKQAQNDVVVTDYINKVTTQFKSHQQTTNKPHKQFNLVEPLTSRELSVLDNIALGKSNSTIASELFISEGTVKWHTSNIFSKLNVKNRTAAVITAKEIQILE